MANESVNLANIRLLEFRLVRGFGSRQIQADNIEDLAASAFTQILSILLLILGKLDRIMLLRSTLFFTCILLFGKPCTSYADVSQATYSSVVASVPANLRKKLNLHSFYQKYVNIGGLPVLGSEKVSDAGMQEAASVVDKMLERRDDIRDALIRNQVRVVVMATTEKTTDVPEHASLQPKEFWDDRARGVGATPPRPVSSCGEENLLNLPGDRYARESILIHEFAHTMHVMGLNAIDPTFDARLKLAYQHAMARGLWANTYAATSHVEYWAETVQSYFDSNDANNKNHNDISTHEKLFGYDPEVFALIDDVFHKSSWRYQRYDVRQGKKPTTEILQVHLTIANKGQDEVSIFWMSGNAPKIYRKLAPGQSYDQVTASGQKWQAVRNSGGATINFVVPDGDGLWTLE